MPATELEAHHGAHRAALGAPRPDGAARHRRSGRPPARAGRSMSLRRAAHAPHIEQPEPLRRHAHHDPGRPRLISGCRSVARRMAVEPLRVPGRPAGRCRRATTGIPAVHAAERAAIFGRAWLCLGPAAAWRARLSTWPSRVAGWPMRRRRERPLRWRLPQRVPPPGRTPRSPRPRARAVVRLPLPRLVLPASTAALRSARDSAHDRSPSTGSACSCVELPLWRGLLFVNLSKMRRRLRPGWATGSSRSARPSRWRLGPGRPPDPPIGVQLEDLQRDRPQGNHIPFAAPGLARRSTVVVRGASGGRLDPALGDRTPGRSTSAAATTGPTSPATFTSAA